MSEIGMFLQSRIKIRTSKGKDVDGTPFEPYNPAYALFRQKKGHPTDKVTLFFTGSMMSSMTYDATNSKVRLFFMNTEDKTEAKNPKKAFFLNEKREFFAMSREDIIGVMEIVQDFINRKLRD